ncbi:MAG TPA: DNRLRE domain-containing protein [Puia sp.]|nr:DNRLRE domain-containing protein [Puia sp.]
MKSNRSFWLVFAAFLALASCFKRSIPIPHPPATDSVVTVNDTDQTLILRPDSTTGQDSYVSKLDDYPTDGNVNLNFAHEMVLARWVFSQDNYDSATQRGYIRFDSLRKIPSTATVTSAILYLYGESTSLSYPYGNSYYPGSYNPPNPGLIQRVVGGTWDQKTITWNNAPALTSVGQDTIPASTSAFNYNVAVDVTSLVRTMVDSPATNYGFGLRLITEQASRTMQFGSCEVPDSTLRPKLVVRYH